MKKKEVSMADVRPLSVTCNIFPEGVSAREYMPRVCKYPWVSAQDRRFVLRGLMSVASLMYR